METPRSQPHRLDYTGNDPELAQIIANADEMFQVLFDELRRQIADLAARVTALE